MLYKEKQIRELSICEVICGNYIFKILSIELIYFEYAIRRVLIWRAHKWIQVPDVNVRNKAFGRWMGLLRANQMISTQPKYWV